MKYWIQTELYSVRVLVYGMWKMLADNTLGLKGMQRMYSKRFVTGERESVI